MFSNIYEEPSLIMDVRYSKGVRGDGGERVEQLVDIYESVDTSREHQADLSTRDRGAHTQLRLPAVQPNPFRAAALTLGLLCILLLVGGIVLSMLYMQITMDRKQLSISHNELQDRYETLMKDYCQVTEKESQTQGNTTGWKPFRCSCYYKSTDVKNWSDSRKDCQSRGADLVIVNSKEEQEFVSKMNEHGASWIGLQSEKENSWSDKWRWKWVDGSTPVYLVWALGVDVNPVEGSTVYMDVQGKWMHTKDGSKQWICEKQIYDVTVAV
ncbi:CD209 antigen-like protein C [Trachinotus anak]|uniref:CD209 antigen-like protein C n=1 Tax=Trachinotus anak TaxID=443729 RepID=UPI0039F22044